MKYVSINYLLISILLLWIYSCSNSSNSVYEPRNKTNELSRNRIQSKDFYTFRLSPNLDKENNSDAKLIFSELESRLVESGLNLVYSQTSISGVISQKADYELRLSKVNVRYIKFRTKLKLEIEIQCIQAKTQKILWVEKIYHFRNAENTDDYIEYSILADKTVEKLRNKGRI
jgi:hypothetical protein